jgi:cyclophilin family peptidyl-prolyl cis-trans isomerase
MRFLASAVSFLLLTGVLVAQEATEKKVPEQYKVKFETSCGDFVVEVHREWAPKGADRFHELVTAGFYDECRFFRVVPGFMVQWGMNGDPSVYAKWKDKEFADDAVKKSNTRGMMSFASRGPDTRTTQLFINFKDNSRLDGLGFAPFAEVVEGMEVVDKINSQYGENPQQPSIEAKGNAYLNAKFPKLDYIKKATIVTEEAPKTETEEKK